jgi:hypothetical protein
MINLVGFSPLSILAPDGAENGLSGASADRTSMFLGILMERIAQASDQAGAKAPGAISPTQPAADVACGRPRRVNEPAGDTSMRDAFRFVFEHEGSGYVASDAGKESSRYGILQATAVRYGYEGDVRNMSKTQAEAIYQKIWQDSGARDLPPGLALVHFDTYINSPQTARKLLQSSHGDLNVYMGLRARRYARLSALKPRRYAQYMKGWMKRIQDLSMAAAQTGPASTRSSV